MPDLIFKASHGVITLATKNMMTGLQYYPNAISLLGQLVISITSEWVRTCRPISLPCSKFSFILLLEKVIFKVTLLKIHIKQVIILEETDNQLRMEKEKEKQCTLGKLGRRIMGEERRNCVEKKDGNPSSSTQWKRRKIIGKMYGGGWGW